MRCITSYPLINHDVAGKSWGTSMNRWMFLARNLANHGYLVDFSSDFPICDFPATPPEPLGFQEGFRSWTLDFSVSDWVTVQTTDSYEEFGRAADLCLGAGVRSMDFNGLESNYHGDSWDIHTY